MQKKFISRYFFFYQLKRCKEKNKNKNKNIKNKKVYI